MLPLTLRFVDGGRYYAVNRHGHDWWAVVTQYVAVCCSVLQCVAVSCSVLQSVAVCGIVWQCVAVRGSVL